MTRPRITTPVASLRPRFLHAAVARADGPSSEVTWDGATLTYRSWRGNVAGSILEVPVWPGIAEWERFWAAMDSIDVWSWKGRYDAAQDIVGPGWILRVTHGPRIVDVSGLAAFPGGSPGRPGEGFRRMCRELSALAGNRPIG